jgi:hypothetical protein
MGFKDEDSSKYAGFRVHWDKELNTHVFASPDERDRWQLHHYGKLRNGFLGADEQPDGQDDRRPRIVYREPFWRDAAERLGYEQAVAAAPPREYGKLDVFEYLGEIIKLAEGIGKKAPPVQTT